jgi:hypothetical protein
MHRIDAISPILNVTTNPYIHFIRDNDVYQIAQCTFNHMPVDIPPADYIRANEFDSAYKIALHHGAVNSAKTDIGYLISNQHVSTDLFDGHDLVLLGDIHKPNQILQEYEYEELEIDEQQLQSYLNSGWQIKK